MSDLLKAKSLTLHELGNRILWDVGVTNVGKLPQEVCGEETGAASKLEHVRGRDPRLTDPLRHFGEIRLKMLLPGVGFSFPGAAVFRVVK